MDNLGNKFKKLRKRKKINIYDACENITSKSSLQRWENGQGEMSIEKVFKLLDRIHIQPKEYVDDLVGHSKLSIYTQKVAMNYQKNDISALKRDAIFLLQAYQANKENIQVFFQAAIACNFYMDLSNENLFKNYEDIVRLKAKFLFIESWTRENVVFFANTQLLIPAEDVYKISRSLYSYLFDHNQVNKFYTMAVNALLNAVFVLFKKRDIKHANRLLENIKTLNLPDELTNEIIRINYADAISDFINKKSILKINMLLSGLKLAGLEKLASDYKLGFSQFKEIYVQQ